MKTLKSLFLSLFILFSGFVFSQTTHSYSIQNDQSLDDHLLTVQPGDKIELVNSGAPQTFGIRTSQDGVNYTQILSGYMEPGVVFDTLIGQDNDNFYLRVVMADGLPLLTINVTVDNTANLSSLEDIKFNVYPNPFVDYINIDGFVNTISILDLNGKVVYSDSPNSSNIRIDMNAIKNEVYMILINDSKTFRVIKQ